jgi:ubiquinone/menaquinone biosynthesis C-methylase UbiE
MSTYGAVFSRIYDFALARGERAGMRELRRQVLADAHGDVLEIGAGTGLNLALYPENISSLTLAEPEPSMIDRLQRRATGGPRGVTVVAAPGERLPFSDDSFDTVVSTLVLCTVADQSAALAEVRRVLRSAGSLLLIEHVRASDGLATWQDRLHGPWKMIGYGCNCNLDTVASLADAGFDTTDLRPARWRAMPRIVAPLVSGRAVPASG